MGGSLKPLAPKRKKSQNRKPPTKKGAVFLFFAYDAIHSQFLQPILAAPR
jgi:hypothetical protein